MLALSVDSKNEVNALVDKAVAAPGWIRRPSSSAG